jgi:hypothetical protein
MFTGTLIGALLIRGHLGAMALFLAVVIIAVQILVWTIQKRAGAILVWREAKRADATATIPAPLGAFDRQETNAVRECLMKAGFSDFSEPPSLATIGVSAKGTVYTKPHWGTMYVSEGGYWAHQIAFANETLEFEGHGARTLESHLRLLELTGRLRS